MGNITVYFKDLNVISDDTYHHEFIVWTDDHGNKTYIRGGPKPGWGGGSGSSGVDEPGSGFNFPFGPIWVSTDPYNNAARDYPKSGTDPGDVVATGPDSQLAPDFQKMVTEGNKINRENIGYAFGGPNSNTVVTTLLKAAGLRLPTGNKLIDPLASPGADMTLDNGHYSATRGYLALIGNAFDRGLHDVERGFRGASTTSPRTHESPRLAEDGFRSPVVKVRAAAATARALYAAKQAAENAADPMRALRTNVTAMARGKTNSVAPVWGTKPGARAPFGSAHHTAMESFRAAIRRMVHDRPAYATHRALLPAGEAAAPVGTKGHAAPGEAASAPRHALSAASIDATAPCGQGFAAFGRAQPGSFIAQASELRKAMAARTPWMASRARSESIFSRLAAKRQNTLPSIAPIGRRDGAIDSDARLMPYHFGPADFAGHHQSAPSPPVTQKIDRQKLRGVLEDLLSHQARLPPSGATAFDPRLTPAWSGQQPA